MKYQEYSKHYNPIKDIEVEGKVSGFKGDFIIGLIFMALLVICFIK